MPIAAWMKANENLVAGDRKSMTRRFHPVQARTDLKMIAEKGKELGRSRRTMSLYIFQRKKKRTT
jgi:hypothetical protein